MTSPHIDGPFCSEAWSRTAAVREAIDALPFLQELGAATLPTAVFEHYLVQDAHYLVDYGRALSAAASQARSSEEMAFWVKSAQETVEIERAMQEKRVGDFTASEPSPTTLAYTSYLMRLASLGNYPVLAAGLLPCFWIYDDVGTRFKAALPELDGHPYRDWISTYGDPAFTAASNTARSIVEDLAQRSDEATVAAMHTAFYRASQYEWMFWDSAYRQEAWPV